MHLVCICQALESTYEGQASNDCGVVPARQLAMVDLHRRLQGYSFRWLLQFASLASGDSGSGGSGGMTGPEDSL